MQNKTCPFCGSLLRLVRLDGPGSVWIAPYDLLEAPAAVPICLSEEVSTAVSDDAAVVLNGMLMACQTFATPIGVRPTINALFNTPNTKAAELLQLLPPPILGKLALMSAAAFDKEALEKARDDSFFSSILKFVESQTGVRVINLGQARCSGV